MPERDLVATLVPDHERDLVEVLRNEAADALLEISQDGERGRLHPTKAPRLPKGGWPQPQRDRAGPVQTQMVVLVLTAEGLQVGRIIALAGGGLLGHGGERTADGGLIQSAELEAVHPSRVAQMLQHLPGNHRALAAWIGGNDDPLNAPHLFLDGVELGRMRLAGAVPSSRGRDVLEHDWERIKAPGLPLGADVSWLLGCEQVSLGRHTNGGGRLEEALELAHGRGLLEEEQGS